MNLYMAHQIHGLSRWVSSSRVGLVVGKKPNSWTTHPMADLALKVADGWCTRLV